MKLSYREKIILMIVVAIITLAVGFFVVLKPQITKISNTSVDLVQKKAEQISIEQKIASAKDLQEKLNKLYEEDKSLAAFYFPEIDTYEIDKFVYPIAAQNSLKIEELKLAPMEAADIELYEPESKLSTSYPLQAAADLSTTAPVTDAKGNIVTTVPVTDASGNAVTTTAAVTAKLPNSKTVLLQAGISTAEIKYTAPAVNNVIAFFDSIDALDRGVIVTGCEIKTEEGVTTGTVKLTFYNVLPPADITNP